jgi:hypothetical protein
MKGLTSYNPPFQPRIQQNIQPKSLPKTLNQKGIKMSFILRDRWYDLRPRNKRVFRIIFALFFTAILLAIILPLAVVLRHSEEAHIQRRDLLGDEGKMMERSPQAPFPTTGAVLPSTACVSSNCQGDITFYDTAGNTSCGWAVDGTKVPIVALPFAFMGTVSNGNPYCGHFVSITSARTGRSVTAQIVDKCMGCYGYSIDLSIYAFNAIDPDYATIGRSTGSWHFVNPPAT